MNDSEYEIYEYKNNTNNNISWEIENIKNYCSSPQEFWENTTTSKIFKKYLYKLIRKNKLNPTSIAYSTFKTYIFHTAILLCCNQDKYEYFLSIYIPHFKTIKLKKIHSKLHNLFKSYHHTTKTFKRNIVYLLQSKRDSFFYCEQELYKICKEIEQNKSPIIQIKENYNKDLKLYYRNQYVGKVNHFYTKNIYNRSDCKSQYKVQTFIIKYGNRNKHLYIDEYTLTPKEINLLKTKEPEHYNENEVY